MQLDYYRSPSQTAPLEHVRAPDFDNMPPLPTGEGKPRRRKRGRVALALFLVLIVLFTAAIIVLRILFPDDWSLDGLIRRVDGFDFSYEIPGGFEESILPPAPTTSQENTPPTTIPRADLDSDVQMHLIAAPEHALGFQEIYEKVLPSIVSIQAYTDYGGSASGTGVILTEDGYVVTNHHIIAGCSSVEVVLFDEALYEAKLVGSDVESDLAVLKIEATGLTAAEFGNSDQLRVGDTALAIGNPLGSELFGTLTEGIISAINRDVNVDGYTMSLIQTTAALNPGNSGGALINSGGQVIGITNMKMMSDYETIEGLGFAIPTVWAKEVVDTLLSQGVITGRPTIGFTCFTVTPEDAVYWGHAGVCIEEVTAGGPAALAGVCPGDIVIEANGQTITSLEDLTLVRDEAGIGGIMELTVWRDGQTLELTLTLVDQYELNT